MRSPESGTLLRSGLAMLLFAVALQASAMQIDYDNRRAASLRNCDEPLYRGQADAARACFQSLMRSTRDALTQAESAWALGDLRGANELFRQAVAASDSAVLPRVRWGRMFQDAGQTADAMRLFQEALQASPRDVGARLAMTRATAEQFNGDVTAPLAELLAQDDTLIEAHLIAARVAIEDGQLETAGKEAQRALALAQQQRRPPLEAQTLLAAIDVIRDRDPREWTQAALKYNPRYGDMFVSLGYFEVIRRRYREADLWLRRAVEVQPDSAPAQRELGLNLMRLGNMTEARTHLVKAYDGDPFSATTVNTLRLLDSLEKFEVARVTQPPLNLQLSKSESAAMLPYVELLARESVATFSKRYGYAPTEPITVEVYPNHDDFAVRTAGLPGIGLLGVTFGNVVAMDSPSGRRSGDFHWGSTLWHEMAHVFTLSVTRNRVPRWLSEGLSVYEEWTTGPTPGVAVTPPVLDTFIGGKLLPIARLDEGFLRPSYENQVQISYQQAGLACLFAEQRFGFAKVVEFLRAFNDDPTTAQAIRAVFKVEPEQFDREFDAFMKQRFAMYLADPKRWTELMGRSHRLLEARNWSGARDAAQAAIQILPEFTESGSAYEVLATAEHEAGNDAAAIAALEQWRKAGGWDPDVTRELGKLLAAAGNKARAAEVLASVNYSDPLSAPGHDRLGDLLLANGRGNEALREYQVLLALQPLDTATAQFGLARAYRQTGNAALARRSLLESLDTAPNYRPAQKLLLEMTGDRNP
jgi:cellulose synthase operon protein C